jgi:hypothetical protein
MDLTRQSDEASCAETVGTEICPAVTVINLFRRNSMSNDEIMNEALQRIAQGDDPELLVHFINDDPRQGLSNGITLREYQRGGYISLYYRLKDLAEFGIIN